MPLSTRNKALGAFRLGGARLVSMRALQDTVFTIVKTLKHPALFSLFVLVSVAVIFFRGVEFGILGIAVLLYANYILAKKIRSPLACAMPEKK